MNDWQLLSAYVQGDEQAFETLVKKYFRMVHAVAVRQTGDAHLAEEIAQSVFVILARKARGISSKTSVPGWLLQTTRYVGRDALKMRRRRDQNDKKLAATLQPQLETRTDINSMELLLDEAIQTLRPDEQAGIVARYFEGKDFPEIAEMFAITEDAARKRIARCLDKLQLFMEKRGAKVASSALPGLLMARPASDLATHAVRHAIEATHAAVQGKAASGAATLADYSLRALRLRFWSGLGLKLSLPLLILFVGVGALSVHQWNLPDNRIERLGKAWGSMAQQVAKHRQYIMQTPPNTPGYQATVQKGLASISTESARIISGLAPLVASPPDDRANLTKFFTAELTGNLKLDESQRKTVFAYIENHLAQGATLKDAMKAIGTAAPAEATEIKAMLTPAQQQLFDQTYGTDGLNLFSYAKVIAIGQIGP